MNTLNLNRNRNILQNYKYKNRLYKGDKMACLADSPVRFGSSELTSTREAVREKNGYYNPTAYAPNKISLCAAVKKEEYKTGKSPSNVSFGGLLSNKTFRTLLEKSADNGALCSAAAMLLACCALRPATIMASQNVEMENRKISSAKSIASGLIGFALMFLVSKPIEHAVKKINKQPEKYLKAETIKKLIGDPKNINKAPAYNIATRFFKMSADMIVAAPKGSLTILLIPPLLNIIFKKPKQNKKEELFPPSELLINHTPHATDVEDFANQKNYVFFKGSNNQDKQPNISFKGNPALKIYDRGIEKLAKFFGKILDNTKVQNWAEKAKDTAIENHVMAASGTIVSSFYVINTVKSKKIQEERKGPLIYNSVISWALATSGGYTIDKILNKHIKKFTEKYKEVNKNTKNLDKQLRGISIMKSALVFGMMYRWITPWISTILAEKVWNKKLQKTNTKV